ncbi:hypothetical protein [Mycobacterium sp. EPa45]|uniref:hypothetical protein n=1 Tax=Mycobacterium sp. EPa45 TaxID=1545728 RepID=UPI00130D818D|nr:hypothetical protein [Mycobacterium sp. EPa45]
MTFATAMGDQAGAFAYGLFGIATALGPNASAETSGSASANDLGFNIAINLSPGTAPVGTSTAFAIGVGNVAINLFGSATAPSGHQVNAVGILNGAVTIGGTNNRIYSGTGPGSALNYGFSGFGSGNAVHAGPGPAAIAGSILQTGAVITKVGPGVNINGVSVGGAAATGQSETAESTGAARSPRPTATGHRKPHTATQRRANH